jgi:hypothetical protein
MNVVGEKIEGIADYIHCPWVIPAAAAVSLADRPNRSQQL